MPHIPSRVVAQKPYCPLTPAVPPSALSAAAAHAPLTPTVQRPPAHDGIEYKSNMVHGDKNLLEESILAIYAAIGIMWLINAEVAEKCATVSSMLYIFAET